jgi:hypothetical protein
MAARLNISVSLSRVQRQAVHRQRQHQPDLQQAIAARWAWLVPIWSRKPAAHKAGLK